MHTAFPITLDLAGLLGLYMIAAGVGGLFAPERWRGIVDDFERMPGLVYIAGVFTFALGAVLVLFHNVWTDPLAVIVTLIGWAAAIEGLVLLAFPAPLFRLARDVMRHVRPFAFFTIALGAILLIAGLTGRPAPILV
jgi:uncharacterized protein YjeT (DUF2065 family)